MVHSILIKGILKCMYVNEQVCQYSESVCMCVSCNLLLTCDFSITREQISTLIFLRSAIDITIGE